MKLCGACGEELPRDSFSKKQWQAKQQRRCKKCIDANRAPQTGDEETAADGSTATSAEEIAALEAKLSSLRHDIKKNMSQLPLNKENAQLIADTAMTLYGRHYKDEDGEVRQRLDIDAMIAAGDFETLDSVLYLMLGEGENGTQCNHGKRIPTPYDPSYHQFIQRFKLALFHENQTGRHKTLVDLFVEINTQLVKEFADVHLDHELIVGCLTKFGADCCLRGKNPDFERYVIVATAEAWFLSQVLEKEEEISAFPGHVKDICEFLDGGELAAVAFLSKNLQCNCLCARLKWLQIKALDKMPPRQRELNDWVLNRLNLIDKMVLSEKQMETVSRFNARMYEENEESWECNHGKISDEDTAESASGDFFLFMQIFQLVLYAEARLGIHESAMDALSTINAQLVQKLGDTKLVHKSVIDRLVSFGIHCYLRGEPSFDLYASLTAAEAWLLSRMLGKEETLTSYPHYLKDMCDFLDGGDLSAAKFLTDSVECSCLETRLVGFEFDEALFKQPNRDDCPLCFLPMPLGLDQVSWHPCCGRHICKACSISSAEGDFLRREDMTPHCPFCRTAMDEDYCSTLKEAKARMAANDAYAFHFVGSCYRQGTNGVAVDREKTIQFWKKGASLGSRASHNSLGHAYYRQNGLGLGLERNLTKAIYHLEQAAIKGEMEARVTLGVFELDKENYTRATKHFTIAANAGFETALNIMRDQYEDARVTKTEYANCLRAYHTAVNDMKSEKRDEVVDIE